ncbi:MAG: DUF4397 domain-containing protein [Acidimicrobiales bacterium]|jgi:hypothetical protein|nr:DUF4397 domain-containing protein [Acidimicrobiales bacterium]
MKRLIGLATAGALLTGGALLGTTSAGAQATSTPVVPLIQTIDLPLNGAPVQVYVVHGLNLDGQSAQGDGGTAVTVCAGPDQLLTDFQFGDIAGPLSLPAGTEVPITVTVGADVPCGTGTPAITQTVTVPDVAAASLVATAGPDGALALLPVVLETETPRVCFPVPAGANTAQGEPIADARLGAVHAANAGQVAVSVDGTTAGELSFGESLFADVPGGSYSVEVTLGGTPIVGPADIPVDECTLTTVYVVGNQPIAGPEPVTPTEPPAAAAVAARPAFTG